MHPRAGMAFIHDSRDDRKPLSPSIRANLPDGQITRRREILSSPPRKNIILPFFGKLCFALAIPPCQEGRLAIVTNVGWDAVDASSATDERACLWTAKPCGSGAVCRGKARFLRGCKSLPARVVPAGSSWSRREGNDRSEASDGKGR